MRPERRILATAISNSANETRKSHDQTVRMAFAAFDDVTGFVFDKAARTERHTVVEFHVGADFARFANHHAGAVIAVRPVGLWGLPMRTLLRT